MNNIIPFPVQSAPTATPAPQAEEYRPGVPYAAPQGAASAEERFARYPAFPANMNRDEMISYIKGELKRRSGRAWSVTGGRGTAWGWIEIHALPKNRTGKRREVPGSAAAGDVKYELYDAGKDGGGYLMTPGDVDDLSALLGFRVQAGGQSIPPQTDYWTEYFDRAAGRTPRRTGTPDWD